MHASTQLPVRIALLILGGLVLIANVFGFEAVFGVFAAGMIVGLATRGADGEQFRVKIDAHEPRHCAGAGGCCTPFAAGLPDALPGVVVEGTACSLADPVGQRPMPTSLAPVCTDSASCARQRPPD